MNLYETVRIAVRSLSANKMRSALTMLGIIIGVSAVIALLSIGQGAQREITRQIQGIGSNLIIVIPGAIRQGSGIRQALGSAPSLTLEDAEALADPRNCPSVAEVAPVLQRTAQVVYAGKNINTNISGVTPAHQRVRNAQVRMGRFIELSDLNARARVAVLGHIPARDLFEGQDPIGQIIKIKGVPFRVVGVMEERGGGGFGGNTEDDTIYIPLSTMQTRLLGARALSGGGRLVSAIQISALREDLVDQAVQEITFTLRRRHGIVEEEDDFTILTQKDILSAFNEVTSILTFFLAAIAAISLLVGGIGIMNIMLVSVTERTREIGIRKAVGAKRRDILMQFLIEAIVLSVAGGGLGILLGWLLSLAVNASGVLTTALSPGAVMLAVGFSVAVGLFFGIYPAVRASALNPIEALRYE